MQLKINKTEFILSDLINTALTTLTYNDDTEKEKQSRRKRKGKRERARRRKGGEEKKAMAALLVFIMATLETVFGRKKLLARRKRPVWR